MLGYFLIAVSIAGLISLLDERTAEQKKMDYMNDLKEREIEAMKELSYQMYKERTKI